MARGKPKAINRPLAKKKPSIVDKAKVSTFGVAAEYDELSLIELIRSRSFVRPPKAPKMITELYNSIVANALTTAVLQLDSGFFQRCKEIIERLQKPADPNVINILNVVKSLAESCAIYDTISSGKIVEKLEKLYPREDGTVYDAVDVREKLKGIGIKCPIKADQIKIQIEEYWRTYWEERDGTHLSELLEYLPSTYGPHGWPNP